MKIILVIVLCGVSIMAQTKSDVRKNYGTLVSESYEVRPNVLLTVTYGKVGQICQMNFKPNLTDSNFPEATSESLTKIVDEVVPLGERGRNIINGFLSGVSVYGTTQDYDKLKIFKVTATQDKENDPYINIAWKDKSCNNFSERKLIIEKTDLPTQ